MKVLIACEESQTVCKAFRELGHEAYSNDLIDCSGGHPEWHLKMDALEAIHSQKWDLLIAHPPCTYLTNSGVCHLHKDEDRWGLLDQAAILFKAIIESGCDKIAVENPIPHKYAIERIGIKYTQIIQPYMFGHMETKATCLWLKGLPSLIPTSDLKIETMALPAKERQRLHYLSPGPNRAKLRSKTFQGIADAMAMQWGGINIQLSKTA